MTHLRDLSLIPQSLLLRRDGSSTLFWGQDRGTRGRVSGDQLGFGKDGGFDRFEVEVGVLDFFFRGAWAIVEGFG